MKTKPHNFESADWPMKGMTLPEVLVVIVMFGFLAAGLLAAFTKREARASRINCISNLKQLGLGFRMWSNDHEEKYPWAVSTTNGGTLELAGGSQALVHYLAASNELTSPKVLTCPTDAGRTKALRWEQLTNDLRHLSYFVGLEADEGKPQSIMSGDRHITTNGVRAVALVTIPNPPMVGWSHELHGGLGNVAMGDGSAHQWNSAETCNQFHGFMTNYSASAIRLVIP